MRGKADNATHAAAIARVLEASPHAHALREHLHALLESAAFRGSRRAQELLRFIVERALDGQFEQLKERTIGMEVFGRPPDYDTGEDSIVRVGASDVRKRLAQFYAEAGRGAPLRIELPSGSYIPEFRYAAPAAPEPVLPDKTDGTEAKAVPAVPAAPPPAAPGRHWTAWLPYLALAVCAAALVVLWKSRETHGIAGTGPSATGMPWSALLDKNRRTVVIISDVTLGAIQDLLGQTVPLNDYAARRYWNGKLPPALEQPVSLLMRRQFTAVPDVGLAVGISELAQSVGQRISVRSARTMQIQDFKTDDNFILLGSVRTNPWVSLFDDQLDFRMEYDAQSQRMICRNLAPEAGESAVYVPTAVSFTTGAAYATVAFFPNQDQTGHILSIAGTNGEGTEIAGRFVTDSALFRPALERAGAKPGDPPKPFQALLRLKAIAGAPNGFEVIAWHWLEKKR